MIELSGVGARAEHRPVLGVLDAEVGGVRLQGGDRRAALTKDVIAGHVIVLDRGRQALRRCLNPDGVLGTDARHFRKDALVRLHLGRCVGGCRVGLRLRDYCEANTGEDD